MIDNTLDYTYIVLVLVQQQLLGRQKRCLSSLGVPRSLEVYTILGDQRGTFRRPPPLKI